MLSRRLVLPCLLATFCACSSDDDSDPTEQVSAEPSNPSDTDPVEEETMMTAEPEAADVATGPVPSDGCGKADPPQGAGSLMIRGAQADYVVNLPPDYDPDTPMPLIFGFHGRNRTHVEFQTVDAREIRTQVEPYAVMAYLKSQGGAGWENAEELEPSVEFFEAMYDQMLANYCIDTSRVFAMGHSSGGFFSNILGCRFGDRLRAVGAIAGALEDEVQPGNCQGQVAALVIHGVRDAVVNFENGEAERDYYLEVNGCGEESTATGLDQCVRYEGCASGFPVEWCPHEDPYYQDTNHGWPLFASEAAAKFFLELP